MRHDAARRGAGGWGIHFDGGTQRGMNMSSERRVSDKQLTNIQTLCLNWEFVLSGQIDGLGDAARIIIAIYLACS
jgi:hypothetical protein